MPAVSPKMSIATDVESETGFHEYIILTRALTRWLNHSLGTSGCAFTFSDQNLCEKSIRTVGSYIWPQLTRNRNCFHLCKHLKTAIIKFTHVNAENIKIPCKKKKQKKKKKKKKKKKRQAIVTENIPYFRPKWAKSAPFCNCRNLRGLGKSMVVFRYFEKLRYSNEKIN